MPLSRRPSKAAIGLGNVDNTSDATKNAAAVTLTNKTLTSPVINTSVSGSAVATAATASTLALRDSNANLTNNAYNTGFTSTATSAGVLSLSISSTGIQELTGSTTHTVRLPTTSIIAGATYTVINNSSGVVTVESSGANSIAAMAGGTTARFTALVATPTTAANWDSDYATTGGDVSSNTATSVDSEIALFNSTSGKSIKRATGTGIATLTSGVLSTTATTGSGNVVLATSPTLTTPNLGTPSALTLTNATGLPVAGITSSTSTALGVGSLELGNASDTTISRTGAGAIAVEGVGVALNSTSLAHTAGTIELGNASDTTLSRSAAGRLAVEGVDVVTISSSDTLTNKTLTSPVINTSISGSAVATGASASTLALRDSNANLTADAYITGFLSTATSAGTLILDVNSVGVHEFTGSTTHTLRLPTTSIVAGASYTVINNSSGIVTVQSSGTNTVSAMSGGTTAHFTALVATPTTAAHWDSDYAASGGGDVSSNTGTSVDNEIALFNSTSGKSIKRATGTGIATLTSGVLSTTSTTGSGNVVLATSPTLTTPNLGTPSALTLTNATGLPVAGITSSTSTALGVGSLEVGNASDTTISRSSAGVIAVEGVTVPLNSVTSTHTAQQIELGNASDTTLARGSAGRLTVEGVNVPTISSADTLTNKTISGTNNTITNLPWSSVTNLTTDFLDNNIVLGGDFQTDSYWTNAWGTQTTAQALEAGGKSHQIVSTGAGATVDYLVVTHDGTGTPVSIKAIGERRYIWHIWLRAHASNTGGGNVILQTFQTDWGGATSTIDSQIDINTEITNSTWERQEWYHNINTPRKSLQFRVCLDSSVPAGDTFYIGGIQITDISGAVGVYTSETIQNKSLDDSNDITIIDTELLLEDNVDTTKTMSFNLSNITSGNHVTLNVPAVNGSNTLITLNSIATMQNKRIVPRVTSVTSSATPTYDTDDTDLLTITALAANITSMSASGDSPAGNMTGTPNDGQKLLVRIKDNGTARTITWGPKFQSSGTATLLATTIANKEHNSLFIYSSATAKWVCLAVDSVGY